MQTPAKPSSPTRAKSAHPAAPQATRNVFFASAGQFAVLLVAVLISATAYALDSASDQVADKTTEVNAVYLLKTANDLEHALDRAVADNGFGRGEVARTVALDEVGGSSRIGLFDARLRYGRAPQWPEGLLAEGVEGAGGLRWADPDAQVIEVSGIDLAVCRRLNEKLQGTAADRAPPTGLGAAREGRGWTQGCWAEAGAQAGTWFMEVFAEAYCRGPACGRDAVSAESGPMTAARQSGPAPVATSAEGAVDAEEVPPSPMELLAQCAAREAAAGVRDPEVVAARCTVSS